VCFSCLTYIPFLICWQLLHVFGVANHAIRSSRWRCLQSLSTHLREDIFIIFFPRFSSTNQVLLPWIWCFKLLTLLVVILIATSEVLWISLNLYWPNLCCATLIPHSTLAINVNLSRRVKLHILLTTWLPIPWIILTSSHGRRVMYSYMPSLIIQQSTFVFSHAMLCLIIPMLARWFPS